MRASKERSETKSYQQHLFLEEFSLLTTSDGSSNTLPPFDCKILWNNLCDWLLIHIGSVYIKLILLKLKIENWKHYSKIIFKCVKSTVGLIFNEKVAEKWSLWVPLIVHGCIVHERIGQQLRLKKKKAWKCARAENVDVDVYPNGYIVFN